MVNEGIGGQEAPIELQRFDTDVIAEKPDLVIWQVGTNAVWQSPDLKPPPPSFDETTSAIRDGLVKLRDETQADVDPDGPPIRAGPADPGQEGQGDRDGQGDQRTGAGCHGVNVFRRFAFMKGLYQVEQVSFDRMVDPADDTDCTTATGPRIVWRGR